MIRIQKLGILCPVCNKPDGCLVADDGTACICARIEEGSIRKVGQGNFRGGYLHVFEGFKPKSYVAPEAPDINWNSRMTSQAHNLLSHRKEFAALCHDININPIAALRFNVGWLKDWLTIPIYSKAGEISGIQRRAKKAKRYMEWSGVGVFVPTTFFQHRSRTMAVCEGWTDAIAAICYGYNPVAKMNAFCGNDEVLYFAEHHPTVNRVILFADNNSDGVGEDGARETAGMLDESLCDFETKVVVTPRDDLRRCWLNRMDIEEVIGG